LGQYGVQHLIVKEHSFRFSAVQEMKIANIEWHCYCIDDSSKYSNRNWGSGLNIHNIDS